MFMGNCKIAHFYVHMCPPQDTCFNNVYIHGFIFKIIQAINKMYRTYTHSLVLHHHPYRCTHLINAFPDSAVCVRYFITSLNEAGVNVTICSPTAQAQDADARC